MIRKNMIIEILVMVEIVKYLSFHFISFNYTFLKETKILLLIKYYSISMNHSVIIPEFIPYAKTIHSPKFSKIRELLTS